MFDAFQDSKSNRHWHHRHHDNRILFIRYQARSVGAISGRHPLRL